MKGKKVKKSKMKRNILLGFITFFFCLSVYYVVRIVMVLNHEYTDDEIKMVLTQVQKD